MASIRRKRRRRKVLLSLLRSILEIQDSHVSSSPRKSRRSIASTNLIKYRLFSDPVSSSYLRLSTSAHIQPSSPPAAGQQALDHTARAALEKILTSPIDWQPASDMTFENERQLRPRRVKGETPLQRTRSLNTSRIEKSWPTRCTKLAPKGLHNPAVYCYRRSVMQSLLHLPQFMRWIDTHGQGANTCFAATNQTSSGTPSGYIASPSHAVTNPRCLACAMKAFISIYWDPANATATVDRRAVRAFDNALRASPILQASGIRSNQQEDADEFLTVLLTAFETATLTPAWRDEFASLFRLDATNTDVCQHHHCGSSSNPPVGAETALRLHIRANAGNYDTIINAIRRNFASERIKKYCTVCSGTATSPPNRTHIRSQTIDASPEILIVQLVLFDIDGNKIRTPVKFDDWLDLTEYQTDKTSPLRYKLSSVVSHQGRGARSGHYIAHVSGPKGTYIISDQDVARTSPKMLAASVQVFPKSQTKCAPYLLFYTKNA